MKLTGWVWVAILVGVGVIEVALVRTHHPTLSQWARHISLRRRWFKWVVAGAAAVLLWHLFWGPASTFWEDQPPAEPAGIRCDE